MEVSAILPVDSSLVVGVRVIRLGIWTRRLFWDWCSFIVARESNVTAYPPMLAPEYAPQVYFTDLASVGKCYLPEDYARRMTLDHEDKFRDDGALIIFFSVQSKFVIPGMDDPSPFTEGGARQWITEGNVFFDEKQLLLVIPSERNVPLPPKGSETHTPYTELSCWTFQNPELVNPRCCESMLKFFDEDARNRGRSDFTPEGINEIRAFLEYSDHE